MCQSSISSSPSGDPSVQLIKQQVDSKNKQNNYGQCILEGRCNLLGTVDQNGKILGHFPCFYGLNACSLQLVNKLPQLLVFI